VTTVLVVEDEPGIASFVARGLRGAGYVVQVAVDGATALEGARDGEVDLVVLDLGLPDLDGLEVLRQLRARGERLPVIVLTARASAVVEGLDAGADDHVSKPYAFDELLARVRTRLRAGTSAASAEVRAPGVVVDLVARTVTLEGRTVTLTDRELRLAEHLVRNAGHACSREELLAAVWGDGVDRTSNVADVYVTYLRRKLGDRCIRTVRGVGWRWVGPQG
jgi:DNA-binding response OmpR family regulator